LFGEAVLVLLLLLCEALEALLAALCALPAVEPPPCGADAAERVPPL
jgi:hypothetical protein